MNTYSYLATQIPWLIYDPLPQGVLFHHCQEHNALSRVYLIWNNLPDVVKSAQTLGTFHKRCIKWLAANQLYSDYLVVEKTITQSFFFFFFFYYTNLSFLLIMNLVQICIYTVILMYFPARIYVVFMLWIITSCLTCNQINDADYWVKFKNIEIPMQIQEAWATSWLVGILWINVLVFRDIYAYVYLHIYN